MSQNLTRLGDDIAAEFKKLQAQSLPAEEFWRRLAEFTMKRVDTLRGINALPNQPPKQ